MYRKGLTKKKEGCIPRMNINNSLIVVTPIDPVIARSKATAEFPNLFFTPKGVKI